MQLIQRWLALICLIVLLGLGNSLAETASYQSFVYGQSELGRDLICHQVDSGDAEQSILIVFGVHGFEDAFDHDGEVLRMIAEKLISHYRTFPEEIRNFRLYIIPSANPDGLLDGHTNHGFGRCNANGIDINRDFPFDWEKDASTRNQTGKAPLSTEEARAICALVEKLNPTYGIDVHGWKNAVYGNGKMAESFAWPFRIKVKRLSTEGMLGAWLHSMTIESILIELPYQPDTEAYVDLNSSRLIEGINAWVACCSR